MRREANYHDPREGKYEIEKIYVPYRTGIYSVI